MSPLTRIAETLRRLLTEDHCTWANRYVYWLKSPLGVLGVSAVTSLLFGVFVAPQGYLLLAAIMATIVIGLAWPNLGIRGLECELEFLAQRAREGQPTPVEVRITNRWPWPVWGLVIEDGFLDIAPGEDASAVALARIGGWSKTSFRWEFTPERRGRFPSSTPSLSTAFPFGLWKASQEVSVRGTIVAWPKTFWLPPYPLLGGAKAWVGDPSDAYEGNEGERVGVRDHRHGDSMRLVHWAKTARLDRLIISERQGAAYQTAVVRVDAERRVHEGTGADSSLEWSIRIAASVADAFLNQGIQVEMHLGDSSGAFEATRSDNAKLMDWLSEFDGISGSSPPYGCAHRRHPNVSARLLIGTSRSETKSGESMILLDTDAFSEGRSNRKPDDAPTGWILVNEPADVPEQVLRGWRRAAKEAHRGA